MTGEESLKFPYPGFINNCINLCTYFLYKILKVGKGKVVICNSDSTPLLITGLFRSGTTITARIINDLGYSAGPADGLLHAKGIRKSLNPDGFLENYFFMELSLYLFFKTNSWGDTPPEKSLVKKISLTEEDESSFAYLSLVKIHDDRISNINKLRTLLKSSAVNPVGYFKNSYTSKSFIKNPHFAVLLPYFMNVFPQSNVLVVFRNPADTVSSALKITPNADYELYYKYYYESIEQFKNGNTKISFFSYDELVENTAYSVQKLAEYLDCSAQEIQKIEAYIKGKVAGKDKNSFRNLPENVRDIFGFMTINCINRHK